jgi:hypothetical protein
MISFTGALCSEGKKMTYVKNATNVKRKHHEQKKIVHETAMQTLLFGHDTE